MGGDIAGNVIKAIISRKNTVRLDVHFRFNLIQADPMMVRSSVPEDKMKICPLPTNAEAKARYLQAVRYLGIVLSRKVFSDNSSPLTRRQVKATIPVEAK